MGGKIETGESGIDAAYRELYEETGISNKVKLEYLMDIVYHKHKMVLEIYTGIVWDGIHLVEEYQKLFWFDRNEDFFDSCFAGEGNIGHIIRQMNLGIYSKGMLRNTMEGIIWSSQLCLIYLFQ